MNQSITSPVVRSIKALALLALCGSATPLMAQNQVLAFDSSADTVLSSTALLLTAQGTQYQGIQFSGFQSATAESFVTQLESGGFDIAILDLTDGRPNGPWVDALDNFIARGGCGIVTVQDPADAAALGALLEASIGTSHDDLAVTRWNSSALFDSSEVVPSPLSPVDDAWDPNGFRLEPLGGATADAGFVPDPAVNEAAIVVGNGGRTILNGFLMDDFYPGDADLDTVDDARELAQNQLFAVALAGCIGQPSPLEIPTQGPAGLAVLAIILAAGALATLKSAGGSR